jgi:hypothetical protein
MKRILFNFNHSFGAFIIVFTIGFISCEKNIIDPIVIDPNVPISYNDEIKPILSKCSSCHGSKFSSYSSIIDGGYVNTTTPESSELYQKLYVSPHKAIFTDAEKQQILIWIQQGADDN